MTRKPLPKICTNNIHYQSRHWKSIASSIMRIIKLFYVIIGIEYIVDTKANFFFLNIVFLNKQIQLSRSYRCGFWLSTRRPTSVYGQIVLKNKWAIFFDPRASSELPNENKQRQKQNTVTTHVLKAHRRYSRVRSLSTNTERRALTLHRPSPP